MKKLYAIIIILLLTSLACSGTNNLLSNASDGLRDALENQVDELLSGDFLTNIPNDVLTQIPNLLTQIPDDLLTQLPDMLTQGAPASTPVAPVVVIPQYGSISGTLTYPSEFLPGMTIVARDMADPSHFYVVYTEDYQGDFEILNVSPGSYTVIAYASIGADIAGAYSQMVPCGLLYTCEDHSLIPVLVVAGEDTGNIQPWDWYAPVGTFPPNPVP